MSDIIQFRAEPVLAAALTAEAERTGATVSDVVRRPLAAAYCAPRPSYGAGSSWSFVRDAVDVADRGAAALDATRRLAAFQAEFAANTGNASQVVVPAYLPLVAGQNPDRPLQQLCTPGDPITSSNPFGLPGAISSTGVTSTAVEGTGPSGGTLAVPGANVVPTPISGVFDLSRELADSASPAADQVAFAAMFDDYARQTEALVASELGSVTSGTISSGLVPSGAQVATTASETLAADTKKLIARAVKLRRRRLRAVAATGDTTFAEALAAGLDENTGDDTALWRPMGTPTNLSADLASSSGSAAVVGAAPDSVWCWESPVQRFEFRQGLGVVRLAVFGYFAVRVVRPVGVAALRAS